MFEVCAKWRSGKLELPTTPRRWFGEQTRLWQTERLSLDIEHYYRESELPALHRDPFDRLLVAQAIERDLSIVTPDSAIRAYPVAVLWCGPATGTSSLAPALPGIAPSLPSELPRSAPDGAIEVKPRVPPARLTGTPLPPRLVMILTNKESVAK